MFLILESARPNPTAQCAVPQIGHLLVQGTDDMNKKRAKNARRRARKRKANKRGKKDEFDKEDQRGQEDEYDEEQFLDKFTTVIAYLEQDFQKARRKMDNEVSNKQVFKELSADASLSAILLELQKDKRDTVINAYNTAKKMWWKQQNRAQYLMRFFYHLPHDQNFDAKLLYEVFRRFSKPENGITSLDATWQVDRIRDSRLLALKLAPAYKSEVENLRELDYGWNTLDDESNQDDESSQTDTKELRQESKRIFKILDRDGKGYITKGDFMIVLRKQHEIAEQLRLPVWTQQETEERDIYARVFDKIDALIKQDDQISPAEFDKFILEIRDNMTIFLNEVKQELKEGKEQRKAETRAY